jgi:hypothetical protein
MYKIGHQHELHPSVQVGRQSYWHPSILSYSAVEGRASKPLTPLSSIRAPMGLTPFKGSRSILGGGLFIKKHFFKRVKLCNLHLI